MLINSDNAGLRNAFVAIGISVFSLMCLSPNVASAADLEAIERRLGEAIVDGELSIQEAAHMMDALKHASRRGDRQDKQQDVMRQIEHWVESVGDELKHAVESGKLREEAAWKKWHHFKDHELGPKLKGAIKAGHVNEEAAMGLWKELGEMEKHEHGHEGKRESDAKQKSPDWDAIKHRIEGAVKAGKVTREEANEHYADIKKRMAGEHDKSHDSMNAHERNAKERLIQLRKELGAAVKADKISEKEAERHFKGAEREIREHLDAMRKKTVNKKEHRD